MLDLIVGVFTVVLVLYLIASWFVDTTEVEYKIITFVNKIYTFFIDRFRRVFKNGEEQ